ncbi:MAG TPA: hypothetical protein VLL95_12210, partial [Phnomibacter sp.]|nr:hypothetical protein [Phnomibacter sp.]
MKTRSAAVRFLPVLVTRTSAGYSFTFLGGRFLRSTVNQQPSTNHSFTNFLVRFNPSYSNSRKYNPLGRL